MWLIRQWLPIAVAVTFLSGLFCVALQQNYRLSLNDPQIQMAEDLASLLTSGTQPATLSPKFQNDIATSLAPWFAIYDADGVAIVSSGILNNKPPQPPPGLFAAAHADDTSLSSVSEDRLTWQPQSGVRQALVVIQAGKYFVVAGRNMREVEDRIWQMEIIVGLGWIATLIATLGAVWIGTRTEDFITYDRS